MTSSAGEARGRLSSREAPLGADYDLLAAYGSPSRSFAMERDGIGVAGIGGPTIPVSPGPDPIGRAADAAGAALDAVVRAPGGAGTVVAGALPFDERSPALLSVLTSAVRRARPGRTTRVEVIESQGEETCTGMRASPRTSATVSKPAPMMTTSIVSGPRYQLNQRIDSSA